MNSAGICASARSSTVTCSAAVFAPAFPGPEHPGQRLASLIPVGLQRMKPIAVLVVPRRSLLVGNAR